MECRLLSVSRSGERIRPTKEVDLLGVGDSSARALTRVFVSMCAAEECKDGLTFLLERAQVEAIQATISYSIV